MCSSDLTATTEIYTLSLHDALPITNLIVRRRYGAGRTVALNAHGDVVPPGEGWTYPPYGGEVHDGKLYGRASAVSKCDFATFIFATRALESITNDDTELCVNAFMQLLEQLCVERS